MITAQKNYIVRITTFFFQPMNNKIIDQLESILL